MNLDPNGSIVKKCIKSYMHRGLPLITYAPRRGGGSTLMHTNVYKGGGGGSEHDQKYAFCTQVY